MRHTLPHIALRVNDPVRTDFFQHLAMQCIARFGDDKGHPHVFDQQGGRHIGLDIFTDGNDNRVKIAQTECLQRILVCRIGLHHMRNLVADFLHPLFIRIDCQHFMSELLQRHRYTGAKATKSDDSKLFFLPTHAFPSC